MDQDRLPLFQVTRVKSPCHAVWAATGTDAASSNLKRKVGGSPCDDCRLDSQVLRVRAHATGRTEHGITGRISCNITANLFDDPGKLMTGYPRQIDREYLSCGSGSLHEIHMIDGGTRDLHEHLVVGDRGRRYFVEHQLPTVCQQSDSVHARSPCPFGRAWRAQ